MAYELVFTSAEKGVKPGTSGFCTVAHTRGMLPSTVKLLESISSYKVPNKKYTENETSSTPVVFSHYRTKLQGQDFSIISRLSQAGRDHTNRGNKIAHHLLLKPSERPPGGPAWLIKQDDVFIKTWDDKAQLFSEERSIPQGDEEYSYAAYWEEVTGDAGWAGVVAQTLDQSSSKNVYLVFDSGEDTKKLVSEAVNLLGKEKRWQVTFNTYFTSLPAGFDCRIRCCLPDNPLLKDLKVRNKSLVLNLASLSNEPPGNLYVKLARGEISRQDLTEKLGETDSLEAPGKEKKKKGGGAEFKVMNNRNKKHIRFNHD